MTRLDQHHLNSWYALRRGGDITRILDRFRQRHPVVFSHICHTDTEAAGIAVQHGWPVDASEPVERSDAEMDHAHATVAATLAALAAARGSR